VTKPKPAGGIAGGASADAWVFVAGGGTAEGAGFAEADAEPEAPRRASPPGGSRQRKSTTAAANNPAALPATMSGSVFGRLRRPRLAIVAPG